MATDFEDVKLKLKKRFKKQLTLSFSISYGSVYLTAIALAIAGYAVWEIYWYNEIGLYFIKWHTHIAATAALFSFIPAGG